MSGNHKLLIEPLRHPDGRFVYNSRGQLYRARLGGPDGPVLVDRSCAPCCPSCRALLGRGITGRFEAWREGATHPHLTGDIEQTAGLTVEESQTVSARFRRWRPYADEHAVSLGNGSAPASAKAVAGRGVAARRSPLRSDRRAMAEVIDE